MKEEYLTLEQNMCAARIFLNTFGFTLESINNVNEFSEAKIFNKAVDEVGKLYFKDGKVIMDANYNVGVLKASYDIAKVFGFVDIECGNALFGQWSSKINFSIIGGMNINGEILINNSIDSQLGINCNCHPLIKFKLPKKGNVVLQMIREGNTFGLEIDKKDYLETIEVKPWDSICHDIKSGKYDKEKGAFPYRKCAGIFDGSWGMKNNKPLHVFLTEKEYENLITYHDEKIPRISEENSQWLAIQKGSLMKKLDPNMFLVIDELRNLLVLDEIHLLDNLVSVCYDSYTDEEINTLLGIKRQKMNYQDGSDNLINSYYGIGSDSCFLPQEIQKRLLKSN